MALPVFVIPGPCTVVWDGAALGTTKDGVRIGMRTSLLAIGCDEGGTEPLDYSFAGKSASARCIFVSATGIKLLHQKVILGNINTAMIGKCMVSSAGGAFGKILTITETRTPANIWQADISYPLDPDELILASIKELNSPVTFIIAPNSEGKLFSKIPSYIYS